MASSSRGGSSRTRAAAAPQLPVISVARFEDALELVERMVGEHQSTFIEHGQKYRDEHRRATSRPLNAIEAAQVAAGFLDDRSPEERAAAFQQHDGLSAYDEPAPTEVLLAAGVATAPALLEATLRVTALIELPADVYEQARENEDLDGALDDQVDELRQLDLKEARTRASAALAHFADAAGVEPGKAWGLVARSVWQALSQAMSHLTQEPASPSSSLIDSPPSTDGPGEPSSTTPRTATPSLS